MEVTGTISYIIYMWSTCGGGGLIYAPWSIISLLELPRNYSERLRRNRVSLVTFMNFISDEIWDSYGNQCLVENNSLYDSEVVPLRSPGRGLIVLKHLRQCPEQAKGFLSKMRTGFYRIAKKYSLWKAAIFFFQQICFQNLLSTLSGVICRA